MGLLAERNRGTGRSGRHLAVSTLPGTTGRRRIYLVHNGHVDYFAPEVARMGDTHRVALTDRGRVEAQVAGRALANISLDRAICSGLLRTRETAELVLAELI